VAAIEEALGRRTVPIDRFFFDWRGGAPRNPLPVYDDFGDLRALMQRHAALPGATDHAYWSDAAPCSMHIEEVEAIWARIDEADDWSALHAKVAAVRRMGEAMRPQSGQDPRRQRSPERLQTLEKSPAIAMTGR